MSHFAAFLLKYFNVKAISPELLTPYKKKTPLFRGHTIFLGMDEVLSE
jgi:hypothetical protein